MAPELNCRPKSLFITLTFTCTTWRHCELLLLLLTFVWFPHTSNNLSYNTACTAISQASTFKFDVAWRHIDWFRWRMTNDTSELSNFSWDSRASLSRDSIKNILKSVEIVSWMWGAGARVTSSACESWRSGWFAFVAVSWESDADQIVLWVVIREEEEFDFAVPQSSSIHRDRLSLIKLHLQCASAWQPPPPSATQMPYSIAFP